VLIELRPWYYVAISFYHFLFFRISFPNKENGFDKEIGMPCTVPLPGSFCVILNKIFFRRFAGDPG
jgi:hypothetical protein